MQCWFNIWKWFTANNYISKLIKNMKSDHHLNRYYKRNNLTIYNIHFWFKQTSNQPASPPHTHTQKKNLKAKWEMEEISFGLIKNSYGKPRVEIILNFDILTACSFPKMRNKAGCPLSFPTQIYWSTFDIQNVIYLKCVVWWFDTYIHCERIPTIELMHL